MNRRAFTLIELLVVIAIISLLVSILAPTVMAAKNMAKNVKCLTNLRKIGSSLLMYTEENNGYLPRSSMTASMGSPKEPFKVRPWGEALVPYMGELTGSFSRYDANADAVFTSLFRGVYRCPSDRTHIDENWVYNPSQLYLGHWSYAKNVLFEYNANWDPKYSDFSTIGKIRNASATILFGENLSTQMSDHFMVDEWLDDGSNTTVDTTRHGATSNFIFADTHAVPAAFKNVFDPPNGINNFDPILAH